MLRTGWKNNLFESSRVDTFAQLTFPNVFEEHRAVQNKSFVDELWEKPLYFEKNLLIAFDFRLISEIFKLSSFQIDNQNHLVDSFFVYELFAIQKLDPPSVF